jgi:hypothetical protein
LQAFKYSGLKVLAQELQWKYLSSNSAREIVKIVGEETEIASTVLLSGGEWYPLNIELCKMILYPKIVLRK